MIPYILVGMFVAFEAQKLCRAIMGGAGALLGGKRRRSELTRWLMVAPHEPSWRHSNSTFRKHQGRPMSGPAFLFASR
jgi:hypothetical protein